MVYPIGKEVITMDINDIKSFLKENHEQAQYINWDLDIVVTSSAAGYFIGMLDEDGSPYCRLSVEYFRTDKEAQEALDNGTFRAKTWL